jgi:hypothetical protein
MHQPQIRGRLSEFDEALPAKLKVLYVLDQTLFKNPQYPLLQQILGNQEEATDRFQTVIGQVIFRYPHGDGGPPDLKLAGQVNEPGNIRIESVLEQELELAPEMKDLHG